MLRKEVVVRWHDNLIQGQPNGAIHQMGHQPIAKWYFTHFWNVVVLAECLEFRVKVVNAILVRLSSQFLHLIGKLHGTYKYKM